MLPFKSFVKILFEGGNIKVKTSSGEEVSAAPFKMKDRGKQTQDIYTALKSIHDSYHQATGAHLFGRNARALETGSCSAVEDYNGRRWGVECGYLAYKEHPAFEYTENSPSNARPGFAVLTWRDGILTPPELVELDDSGTAWFRGEPVFSEKPRIRVKLTKS
jgi:hypothetical protein